MTDYSSFLCINEQSNNWLLFNYIEENVFELTPTEIMTDFEPAMRKAINSVYKDVTLRGCWFHFCQAIKRMALKLGLRNVLKAIQEARCIYYKLMSLPLLPSELFLNGFESIKLQCQSYSCWRKFHPFFGCFESFWLNQVILLLNSVFCEKR